MVAASNSSKAQRLYPSSYGCKKRVSHVLNENLKSEIRDTIVGPYFSTCRIPRNQRLLARRFL